MRTELNILLVILICCSCRYVITGDYYKEKSREQMQYSSKFMTKETNRYQNYGNTICRNCYRVLPHDIQVDYIKVDND